MLPQLQLPSPTLNFALRRGCKCAHLPSRALLGKAAAPARTRWSRIPSRGSHSPPVRSASFPAALCDACPNRQIKVFVRSFFSGASTAPPHSLSGGLVADVSQVRGSRTLDLGHAAAPEIPRSPIGMFFGGAGGAAQIQGCECVGGWDCDVDRWRTATRAHHQTG